MKKTVTLLLALVMILALAGCGVSSRPYRRYSYNRPATDYDLGVNDGTVYDGTYGRHSDTTTRSTTGNHHYGTRRSTGGTYADNSDLINRTRTMIRNPGEPVIADWNGKTPSGTEPAPTPAMPANRQSSVTHQGTRAPAADNMSPQGSVNIAS